MLKRVLFEEEGGVAIAALLRKPSHSIISLSSLALINWGDGEMRKVGQVWPEKLKSRAVKESESDKTLSYKGLKRKLLRFH